MPSSQFIKTICLAISALSLTLPAFADTCPDASSSDLVNAVKAQSTTFSNWNITYTNYPKPYPPILPTDLDIITNGLSFASVALNGPNNSSGVICSYTTADASTFHFTLKLNNSETQIWAFTNPNKATCGTKTQCICGPDYGSTITDCDFDKTQ